MTGGPKRRRRHGAGVGIQWVEACLNSCESRRAVRRSDTSISAASSLPDHRAARCTDHAARDRAADAV